jgi:hypothetical protein
MSEIQAAILPAKPDHGATEAARHGIARSSRWPHVEKAHLAAHPHCAACNPGSNMAGGMQAHHIFPFHYCIALGRPDLELDDRNLITLCETEEGRPGENHHLLIGHLDDFKSSNLQVVLDASQTFLGMTAAAIKADHRWLAARAAKLKPLDRMTDEDKANFIAAMNTRFPIIQQSLAA